MKGNIRNTWILWDSFWLMVSNMLYFCSPKLGEMIEFDEHFFQMGWNHQLFFLQRNIEPPQNQSLFQLKQGHQRVPGTVYNIYIYILCNLHEIHAWLPICVWPWCFKVKGRHGSSGLLLQLDPQGMKFLPNCYCFFPKNYTFNLNSTIFVSEWKGWSRYEQGGAFWRAFLGLEIWLFWNFWLSKSGSATCTGFFWKPGQVLWSMLEQHAKQSLSWASPCLGRFTVPCSKWMPVDLAFFWRLPCWYSWNLKRPLEHLISIRWFHIITTKKMVFHHFHPFTPRKFNSSPLKKWCLEHDPFLLGPGNFSGKSRC